MKYILPVFVLLVAYLLGCSPLEPMQQGIAVSTWVFYDGTSYSASGNNDDTPNKGETVRMNVELVNFGPDNASDVSLSLSASDPYISINASSSTVSYGTIDTSSPYVDIDDYYGSSESSIYGGGGTEWFLFSISSSCPANHQVKIVAEISGANFGPIYDTISFPITNISAAVEYSSNVVYDGTSYSASGNNDGIANRGEAFRLNVELKNSGTSAVNGVTATLSSSDSYVTVNPASNSHTYGTIDAGDYKDILDYYSSSASSISSAADADCFLVSVSSSCPPGHQITFSLSVTDANNNSWSDTFVLTVAAIGASVEYSKHVFYDGTSYNAVGNADELLNKGETVRMNVELRNTGTSQVDNLSVTLSRPDPYTTINPASNSHSYGTIDAGDYKDILDYYSSSTSSISSAADADCFLLTVSSSCPAGHQIPFTVSITDGNNNSWTDTFNATVTAIGASIEYSANAIYDGTSYSASGNNNQLANAGETVRLNVELKNTGTSAANNLTATLSTTDTYVIVNTASNSHPYSTIDAGDYKDILDYYSSSSSSITSAADSDCFLLTISSSCPSGRQVSFSLNITDNNNNSWSDTFTLTVY
jgi:hypothetical protein